jgi:Domain of unknown function (DUF1990)
VTTAVAVGAGPNGLEALPKGKRPRLGRSTLRLPWVPGGVAQYCRGKRVESSAFSRPAKWWSKAAGPLGQVAQRSSQSATGTRCETAISRLRPAEPAAKRSCRRSPQSPRR